MSQIRAFFLFFTWLLVACGDVGTADTKGAGGAGTGGTSGQGGSAMPDSGGSISDAEPDAPIITCEDRDGNTCTIPPEARRCQMCVYSCCCQQLATCRADATCARGIGAFNECLQKGNRGLLCLFQAVEASDGGEVFAPLAACLQDDCMSLECQL